MFLFEFKNTHIGHIPSLIDQYRSKIKFDNQTFDDNDIVDELNIKHDYEVDIERLNYELETWNKIPDYFSGRGGSKYFTYINSAGMNEHRFTMYSHHLNQFLRRIEGFQKKYSVQLSYETSYYINLPMSNEYLVRIYDLRV